MGPRHKTGVLKDKNITISIGFFLEFDKINLFVFKVNYRNQTRNPKLAKMPYKSGHKAVNKKNRRHSMRCSV